MEVKVNKVYARKIICGHILKGDDFGCRITSSFARSKHYISKQQLLIITTS